MELVYIARAMRRYWWAVAIGVLVGGLLGGVFGRGGSAEYQASALILLSPGSTGASNDRYVQNEIVALGSRTVAARAAEIVGDGDPDSILEAVTIVQIDTTDVVRITASAGSPESARDLANAFADGYLDVANDRLSASNAPEVERLDSAIATLEDELTRVNAEITQVVDDWVAGHPDALVPSIDELTPTLATARSTLEQQYSQLLLQRNELEIAGEQQLGSHVTDYASLPHFATPNGSKLIVAVGIVCGFLVGSFAAIALARLSGRILDPDEAVEVLGTPIAATFSRESALTRHPFAIGEPIPPGVSAEIRELSVRAETSIPAEAGRSVVVVLVAGTEASAGVTTISSAIAQHMAESGGQVLLVDVDALRPDLSVRMEEGLSGVRMLLNSRANRDTHETGVPPRGATRTPYHRTAVPGLRFAGLGPQPTGLPLRRQDIPVLLDAAAEHAQVIVLDGGTLLDSASTVQFAQLADAVILAMPVQRQTRSALEMAGRQLSSARGVLLPVTTAAVKRPPAAPSAPVRSDDDVLDERTTVTTPAPS